MSEIKVPKPKFPVYHGAGKWPKVWITDAAGNKIGEAIIMMEANRSMEAKEWAERISELLRNTLQNQVRE